MPLSLGARSGAIERAAERPERPIRVGSTTVADRAERAQKRDSFRRDQNAGCACRGGAEPGSGRWRAARAVVDRRECRGPTPSRPTDRQPRRRSPCGAIEEFL